MQSCAASITVVGAICWYARLHHKARHVNIMMSSRWHYNRVPLTTLLGWDVGKEEGVVTRLLEASESLL